MATIFGGLPFLLLDAQVHAGASVRLVIARPAGHRNEARQFDWKRLVRAFLEDKTALRSLGRCARTGAEAGRFGEVKVTPYPVVHGESGGPFLAYRIEAEGAHHHLQRRYRMDRTC